MATESTGSVPFPKWQIAVALGATGVIGFGYWYLKQQSAETKRSALLRNTNNSVSIDDVRKETSQSAPETPLERALGIKNQGNKHFKKGEYEAAISKYKEAIDACPEGNTIDLATFYQNLAAAYESLKNWTLVIENCTKALELNSKYEKALYRRAKAYETIKDFENALDDITAGCLINGFQNQNMMLMADRVLKELGRKHTAEAIAHKKPNLASNFFIKSYFLSFSEDPVGNLIRSSTEPMGDGELKGFLKARMCFATENFEEVIPACTEEINSSESESRYKFEAHSLRSTFYFLSGRQQDALDDINTIINAPDADPKIRVNAHIKKATLKTQMGQIESCFDEFMLAIDLCPDISDIYHHRGQMFILMDKCEEAKADFEKAVTLKPEFAIAQIQKCYCDYRYAIMTNDVDLLTECMEKFRKNTINFPDSTEAYCLYAQVLTERQDWEEADKLYLKAINLEPNNATIYVHRGMLLLQWKGDVDGAVELMKKAIKIDDKCEFALETLGTVEVQRGNLILATDLFNKAIDLARNEPELVHLFSLRDAVVSQLRMTTKLGISYR